MENKFLTSKQNAQNKESFDKSPNKPISPPNCHSSPELRVPEELSTKGGEWAQSTIRNIHTVS